MPNNQETICEYKYTLTYVYKDSRQMISTEVYVGHRAFKTKIMGSNIFWIEKDNKYAKTQELVKSKKKILALRSYHWLLPSGVQGNQQMLWRRRSFKSKILGSNIFWIENDDQYRETQEFVKSKKRYSSFDLITDCYLPVSAIISRCYGGKNIAVVPFWWRMALGPSFSLFNNNHVFKPAQLVMELQVMFELKLYVV